VSVSIGQRITLLMNRSSRFVVLLVLPLVFGTACKTRPVAVAESAYAQNFEPQAKSLALAWKNDPWGCAKVRTADKAEIIVYAMMKNKPSEQEIVELLGPAEFSKDIEGTRNLSYYFDGACDGGKLRDGTVYCVLTFTIGLDVNKMDSGGVVCG
jgi:hypothetical protein